MKYLQTNTYPGLFILKIIASPPYSFCHCEPALLLLSLRARLTPFVIASPPKAGEAIPSVLMRHQTTK